MVCFSALTLAPLLVAVGAVVDDPAWTAFKAKYKKIYDSDADESQRYKLFQESQARVEKLNKLNGQPAFGINWMSDRLEEEKYKRGLVKPSNFTATAPVRAWQSPRSPKSIDWRLTDAVTAVKNQGQCGSCWAFSATEAVESQLTLSTGGRYRMDLSPQQVTSCTPSAGTYGCLGCNGGFTEGAYEYLKTVAGLSNSFFIPYEQSLTETTNTKSCPTEKVNALNGPLEQLQGGFAAVSGYSYATTPCTQGTCRKQNLNALAAALEESPVSVCVNAGTWNDYTGGVLTAAACGSMGAADQDHCVMAVGFNTEAPTPYWIVRNSWATTWGEQGYIYLEMSQNTCGLADDATIPEVSVDFLTKEEMSEVASRKEEMYHRATRAESSAAVLV